MYWKNFHFVVSLQTSKCENSLEFSPTRVRQTKTSPAECMKFQCAMFFKLFSFRLNMFHSMNNERLLKASCRGVKNFPFFSIFHSTTSRERWKLKISMPFFFKPRLKGLIHVNFEVDKHWIFVRKLTKLAYNSTQIEAVFKLVSLLWNSQASPRAKNSIPLLKVELYYIVLHKMWNMRDESERTQRRKARNLSLKIFVLFREFIITQIYALHLKRRRKWSSRKLFKC